jgi:hypothetical protein
VVLKTCRAEGYLYLREPGGENCLDMFCNSRLLKEFAFFVVASIVLSLQIRDKVSVCRGTRLDIVTTIVICDMSLTNNDGSIHGNTKKLRDKHAT